MIKTIRAKIIWAFSVLVLLNLATGFWSIYNFYALGTTVSTILHDNYQSVLAAENMMKYLERQDNALLASSEVLDYTGWEDSTSADQWDSRAARSGLDENRQYFDYWHMQVERSVLLPEQETLRDSILMVYGEYTQRADSMLARTYQGAFDKAKQYYYSRVRPMSDVLRQLCFRLFEINQAAMHNAVPATHQVASQIAYGTMLTSIIALLLGIIAAAWLTKVFITPAENLTQTVKQIGAGKLDLKIDVLSDDEIGQLSREFNKMTERLKRYDQMNIEQILAEKRKSEAIVEGIADGLVVTDAAMNIVHMNRVMGDLFGVTESEAIGMPAGAVIRDERLVAIIRRCYTNSGSDGESSKLNALEFKGPEEQKRYFRPKTTRIVNSDGELFGVLTLLQDVTQFKELDRMKSDFIATLSHEFRTPLTSINMSIDILSQGILGTLNEKQKELIEAAKEDCFRLTKLARELLQLSKLESGAVQLKAEVVHIQSVIEHSLRALQLQFGEKNMKLVTDVAADIPAFIADEQQISWVITNLVTNALKYTDAGGTVTVRARQENRELRVEVQDTGQGIAPEHLETIFDKFVQIKQAAGATPGSVGLGLAIAKEIVEMYDGKIWAESEVGKGSTFYFTLPLWKMTAAPAAGTLVKDNEQESIHTAGR